MGVGDLAADDGDEVGLARRNDGFGVVGGSDPGFGGYTRMFNECFKLRCQGGGQLFARGEGRDDAFEIEVGALADGDVVDMAGGVVQSDDFTKILGT